MSDAPPESGAVPEQRGDFMLLPPLEPTFGTPSMIQQMPKDFLVTRRPVAVSTEPVGHTVDSALTGRVPGRARRRMRFPTQELEHLIPPLEDIDDDAPAEASAPRRPSPRPRAVARSRAVQPAPLPSRTDVRRSVSSPPPAPKAAQSAAASGPVMPETIPGELIPPPMPPSTFPGVGDSSSVVRRRGGLPAAPAPHAPKGQTPPGPDEPRDVDESFGRGHQEAPSPTRANPAEDTHAPDPGKRLASRDGARTTDAAPALQRRRSRGRVTTPIVPEDEDDLPPAVKRMLEEIDDPQINPASTPPARAVPSADVPDTAPLVHRTESPQLVREPIDAGPTTPQAGASSPAVPPDSAPPGGGSSNVSDVPEVQRRVEAVADTSGVSGAQPPAENVDRAARPSTVANAAPSPSPAVDPPDVPDAAELVHRLDAVGETPGVSGPADAALSPSRASALPAVEPPDVPDAAELVHRLDAVGETPGVSGPADSAPSLRRTSAPRSESSSSVSEAAELVRGMEPAGEATAASGAQPASISDDRPESKSKAGADDIAPTSLRATTRGTSLAATNPTRGGPAQESSQIRPVLAGRTGIQRRARSRPAPGGSSRGTIASESSGLAGFRGTPTPNVAGPRRVEVPEQVKQALRGSVGEPPTHVTVHEGSQAAQETGAVNAEAFTRDGQIFLAGDAPLSSARGQELLAHELTHVMQQGGRNGSMPGEHTHEGRDLEARALEVEKAMASGARETIAPMAIARPSRDPETPELHHRRDVGTRETPSQSSWSSSPPPPPRPQEMSIPQAMDVSSDIQRRERDLRTSALSRGLGAIGSALEQGLVSNIEQEVLGPQASTKEKDSRYKRLERQAADLYPYIRARLRAELVRDRERRGRIARDWS